MLYIAFIRLHDEFMMDSCDLLPISFNVASQARLSDLALGH